MPNCSIETFKIVNVVSLDDSFILYLYNESNNSFFCQKFYFRDPATDFLFSCEGVQDEIKWATKCQKMLNQNISLMVQKLGNKPVTAIAIIGNGKYQMLNNDQDLRFIYATEYAIEEQGLGARTR